MTSNSVIDGLGRLRSFFTDNPRVLLALSGGVDSSLLLYKAKSFGIDVRPYFVKTAFQPDFELADAKLAAAHAGTNLTVLEGDVLTNADICANTADRCYYCKLLIFDKLVKAAEAEGIATIVDGTNASDDAGDRPGIRALGELNIRSPLRECGITKAEVRAMAREVGLHNWNKPSYACLATRFPTGERIHAEGLSRIEKAEDLLFSLGFSDFRVRLYHDAALIQIPEEQTDRLISMRETINKEFSGFELVTLDLLPRIVSE